MKIILWQLKPSMHQLALVKALKQKSDTTWIMQYPELSSERKQMGWQDGGLKPDIYLDDLESTIEFLKKNTDVETYHLFAGTRSSPLLRAVYLYLLNKNSKVFVQSEASNFFGLKGLLRVFRGKWEANSERKKIAGVFAIGSLGEKYFTMIGFKNDQIIPFGYFIDLPENNLVKKESQNLDSPFQILFVGRLIKTKGVHILLDVLNTIKGNWTLTIVGNGPLETQFKEFVKSKKHLEKRVSFLDFMSNSNILKIIKSADLLVLPSVKKDGWGVVVNEALIQGVPVVASDKCGSTVLLSDSERGAVVRAGSHHHLKEALLNRLEKGKLSSLERDSIMTWAQKSITGDVAADYFMATISGKKQTAPWLK